MAALRQEFQTPIAFRSRILRQPAWVLAVTVAVGSLTPTLRAQTVFPENARGFAPNSTFMTTGLDHVNVFNGNLAITIPIGPNYPVGADFSHQLHLVYNSKLWRAEAACIGGGTQDVYGTFVVGSPVAGAGWTLELGHLNRHDPFSPTRLSSAFAFNYLAPDGSVHAFYTTNDPLTFHGPYLSDDGSNLRVVGVNVDPVLKTLTSAEIDFPSGEKAFFTAVIATQQVNHGPTPRDFDADGLYLTKLRSRYGDSVIVNYASVADGSTQISSIQHYRGDPAGGGALLRTINFYYRSITITRGSTATWSVIDRIEFPTFAGQTQKALFDYNTGGFDRPSSDATGSQYGCSAPYISTVDLVAPLLQTVTLDATLPSLAYSFAYLQSANLDTQAGLVTQMTLPTGGVVQYAWSPGFATTDPLAPGCMPPGSVSLICPHSDRHCMRDWVTHTTGVLTRTEYPYANGAAGGPGNSWQYSRARCIISLTAPASSQNYQMSAVAQPDGQRTARYFHIETADSADLPGNGLEYQTDVLPVGSSTSVRRSTYCYDSDSGGTVCDRTAFGSLGFNVRQSQDYVSTLDSAGNAIQKKSTLRSSWNGYGHFKREQLFDWGPAPGGGPLLRIADRTFGCSDMATTWLLNLLVQQTGTEAGKSITTSNTLDCSNGFLSGTTATDSLNACAGATCGARTTSFTNDGSGNPATESTATSGSGMDGRTFTKTNAFLNGILASSQWSGVTWKAVDRDLDAATGLTKASRDPAGFQTNYTYDILERPTQSTPPGGEVPTVVSYDSPNQTTVTRTGSGPSNSTWQRFLYDGLSRLVREIRKMPPKVDGTAQYSARVHTYDAVGREFFVSEWVTCTNVTSTTSDCQTVSPVGTTSSNFDPFGRPQTITKADATVTAISYDAGAAKYSDTTKSVKVCVNSSSAACTGGSLATTAYSYDAVGRLTSISEPDGNTTAHSYNVLDKLVSVTQGSQTRTFGYDALGFLRGETTPEKGTVSYLQYDALGDLRQSSEPNGVTLTRTYDPAGRLLALTSSEGRTYLNNTYNNNTPVNPATNPSLGKLTARNSLTVNSQGQLTLADSFSYSGSTGRLISRGLTLPGTSSSFETDWGYDALGLIKSIKQLKDATQQGLVSYTYDSGHPVSVNGQPTSGNLNNLVSSATYHPYGGVALFVSGSTYTTAIGADPNLLPRPSQISTVVPVASQTLWNSGAYTYDGAGNVIAIGTQSYQYDLLSRIKSATINSQSQAFAYDRWGSLTQKGSQSFAIDAAKNQLAFQAGVVEYDALGNLKTYGSQRFTFDMLSRQTDFVDTQSGVLPDAYVYDGAGERVARFGAVPPSPTLMILNDLALSFCADTGNITIELLAVGGEPPYTWAATGLNSSITLAQDANGARLIITSPGTYNVALTVTDSAGTTASKTLTITVASTCNAVFDVQPQDVVLCPGESYVGSAAAHFEGANPPSVIYDWQTLVPGTGWVSLTSGFTACTVNFKPGSCLAILPSANPSYYRVVAKRSSSDPGTPSRIATVWIGGPIRITNARGNLICAGQGVNLNQLLTALGCNLTKSWQKQNSDGSWTNTGYQVSPTQTAIYRAVLQADSPPQTAYSPSIEVDVLPQPAFSQVPADQNFCAGSSVTVSAATNTQGTFRWGWWNPSLNNGQGDWALAQYGNNPKTSDSLTLSPTATTLYRLTMSAWCGVITTSFTLTQTNVPTITGMQPNADTCPPIAVTCNPTVTGAASIQWQQNLNGGVWTAIAGATSANYQSPIMTTPGTYGYRLAATNSCGTSYATSYVTVNPPPSASITGSACSVASGQSTTLSCSTDTSSPRYSWLPGGQTTQSITVSPASTTTYNCTVTSPKNCSKSASYTVTVGSQVSVPVITASPKSVAICGDVSSATLSVTATGTNVAYQWQKQNTDGTWSNISGATSSSYVAPAANATCRVVVSNACGSVTSAAATVTVDTTKQSAAFTSQPKAASYCSGGSGATLSVTATGTALSYSWEYSSNQTSWSPVTGANTANVTVSPAASTYYRARISNTCSSVTSNVVTVAPTGPVTITQQPQSLSVCTGSIVVANISVTTSADYIPGTTYQWQVYTGGAWTNITGATARTYGATSNGSYRVQITNPCGIVTSSTATVTFLPQPTQPTIGGPSFINVGQTAHLYIASGCVGCSTFYWSDGTTAGTDDVSPTVTTTYTLYGKNSRGCASPVSPPFTVTVSGGSSAQYGTYSAGSGSLSRVAGALSFATAGTITLAHGAPDKKANKILSVDRPIGSRILVGDWGGDGVGSIGFYDPRTGTFSLWNGDPKGKPDYEFVFGPATPDWQPIAGDWNGDGIDTIGLFNPATGQFLLRNSNSAGEPDVAFTFNLNFQSGIAVVGDWTGKGYDSLGVYNPQESVFYLRDANVSGGPDHAIYFAPNSSGALPLAGDWDEDGFSSLGLYDPTTGQVMLRDALWAGPPDYTGTFVAGADQVFSGKWNASKHAPGGNGKKSIIPGGGNSPGMGASGSSDFSIRWPRPGWLTSGHMPADSEEGIQLAAHRPTRTETPLATQAAAANWNYMIRDESNRPSIEYHINKAGNVIADRLYAYLGNRLVATYEFQPVTGVPGWTYYTSDHLGSIRLAGCQRRDYWPFGEQVSPDTSCAPTQPLRFAGMERDPTSGNDYDHARYLSNLQGRFSSPDNLEGDPEDPQSWNRYVYAYNNPLRHVDPDGESGWDVLAGFGNAVGSNFLGGVGRQAAYNSDVRTGQTLGDVISIPLGGLAILGGAATFTGGVALDATVVAAPVGVVVNAAGATAVAGGASAVVNGAVNLFDSVTKPGSSGGDTAGKRFSKGTQDKATEERQQPDGTTTCANCGVETGNGPDRIKSNTDHIVPRSKGGNATIENAQHVCETCNKSAGNGAKPKTTGVERLRRR